MDPMTAMGIASAASNIVGGIAGSIGGGRTPKGLEHAKNRALMLMGIGGDIGAGARAEEWQWSTRLTQRGGIEAVRDFYKNRFKENLQGAFTGARGAARAGARQARQVVRAQGKQTSANAMQALAATGLDSTTIAQQAQSGISYQTGRALADVSLNLGALLSDLELQESAARDAMLERNMGIDERTFNEQMAVLAANAGWGPDASSMFFGQGMSNMYQPRDPYAAGAIGGLAGDIMSMFMGDDDDDE